MPVMGGGTQVAAEPRQFGGRCVRHVGVDRYLGKVGPDDIAGRLQQDGGGREAGLELIGAEVGEQAAHEAAVVDLADNFVIRAGWGLRLPVGFLLVFFGHALTILDAGG